MFGSSALGSVAIGGFRTSGYSLFLIGAAAALVICTWLVLRFTALGLIARGTMQNADIAATLGVSPARVYAVTFNRMGRPSDAERQRVLARLDEHFPARNPQINNDLCDLASQVRLFTQ